ncbi:DUF222 domain-containing protein [Kribbella sp. CWNU-51]
MEILGERPVWSMSGGEMLSSLDAAFAEIARLETFVLQLIGGLETTGYAQELGAGTTARLLTFRYRIDATKARRDVHLATSLEKFPAVAAALPNPNPNPHALATTADTDTGENGAGSGVLLHPAQAEAIVSALDKVPTTVRAEDLQVAEREMVELARTHGPLELRRAGRLVRDRLDTDGPEPAEQKAYDRESLTLKNADNGVAFTDYLANENAELFRSLIHTHAKPHKTIDGALDPRPRTKRQADALTTLLTTASVTAGTGATTNTTAGAVAAGNHGTGASTAADTPRTSAATTDTARIPDVMLPHMPTDPRSPSTTSDIGAGKDRPPGFIPGHGSKPHITVTIDFNDLKAATADKLGHLIYGDALSAATIRRLACDAHILPIVLGSDSQPLDVGTTVRLATGPIRKALITRDKGCVCCGAPPLYCDAHHVISWIDGGETKITNLVLLCKRCHRDLHAGHWTIQITNGIVDVARPAWATPNPIPCGRYRPPTTTPHATPTISTTTGRASTTDATAGRASTTDAATGRASTTDATAGRASTTDAATGRASTTDAATGRASTTDAATGRASTTDAATGRASTTGAAAGGPVTRAWPRDTDPPWITPDDTARLNPWGDTPDERPTRAKRPPATDVDPWGEGSGGRPCGVPKEPAGKAPAATGLDVWGDPVEPPPTVDRRGELATRSGGTFDPWGDLALDADQHNSADDQPGPGRSLSGPWGDSTKPPGALAAPPTATAATTGATTAATTAATTGASAATSSASTSTAA